MKNQTKKSNETVPGLDFTWEDITKAAVEGKLLNIDIEFSRACNIKCKYCYTEAKKLENEMSIEEIEGIIDQAVELGAQTVANVGGGEPLLYPHFWRVLEKEREVGLKSITLTNGTMITPEIAKRLYNMGEGIVLKLNSFNETIQDDLAQKPGTGKKIKEALKNLMEAGYTKENWPVLAIESIICKQNYDEIETIYRFARENNIVPYIEILTNQGLANTNSKILCTAIEENYELFKRLLKYDEENWGISWPITPPIVGQSCKRMLYSAYVRSDGNIQPCAGLEIVSNETNIRNNRLGWIIKNTKVFRDVRNIRQNLKGACKECKHKECYGCRGTALSTQKDYLAEDPTCWYAQKITCGVTK